VRPEPETAAPRAEQPEDDGAWQHVHPAEGPMVTMESGSGPPEMDRVSLGLFDWVDADGLRSAGQLYRERLDLLADAESYGFDIYHLRGESDHHARERAAEAMEVFYEQFSALWRRHGDDRFAGAQDFARAIERGLVIAGSAAAVRAQLTEMMRACGANHFAGAFAFGSLSEAEARSSLARFAAEVAPALRALGPA
jgi:hypothetical protein